MSLRRVLLVFIFVLTSTAASAALPYNETANASVDVEQALATAATTQKTVLLIFGANWCEDCRALDAALQNTKNAALITSKFAVVKIDVGNFDKNLALNKLYGNPIEHGIPAAVIVSPDNHILYTTRAGELADARKMSETGVYKFFRNAASTAQTKK